MQHNIPLLALNAPFWHVRDMTTAPTDPDSRPAIAQRLRRLRKALKLTQAKIAERLGLENQQTYGHYETNKRPLPYEVAQKISHEWGIPMDWIYRGLTPMLPSIYAATLRDEAEENDSTKEIA